jgi:hypothetical protein
VKIVAGQPIGHPEGGDAFAQRPLLALEPLGFGFTGAKFEQKPLHQCGDGRVPLGRYHAGSAVGFVIQ